VAFTRPRERAVYAVPAAGGEPSELLRVPGDEGTSAAIDDWSPDGHLLAGLVVMVGDSSRGIRGVVVALDGKAAPVAFDEAPNLDETHFSSDGNWIAYNADRTGSGQEVYAVPSPPTGERVTISVAGGSQPRWRGDGKELFYLSPDGTTMAVAVDTVSGRRSSPGTPVPLFETGIVVDPGRDQYAVTRDGQRFLLAVPADQARDAAPGEIIVVLTWEEELKARVPVR
jgi:WD40-like Beta Propeller Repeat